MASPVLDIGGTLGGEGLYELPSRMEGTSLVQPEVESCVVPGGGHLGCPVGSTGLSLVGRGVQMIQVPWRWAVSLTWQGLGPWCSTL